MKEKNASEKTKESALRKREDLNYKFVSKNVKTLSKFKSEFRDIDSIFPNEWNPNRQTDRDFELLLRSIEDDGFTQPVIANREGKIIDGEHRWRAAEALGYSEVPVVVVDMSDEQMRISTIRHNKARGSHDTELEVDILRDLKDMGASDWVKDSLLISDAEFDRLLGEFSTVDSFEEEFREVPQREKSIMDAGSRVQYPEVIGGVGNPSTGSRKTEEEQRLREQLISQARSEQEQEWARRDTRLYRVALVFSGDESEIVKQALGDSPGEALLAMCEAKLKKSGELDKILLSKGKNEAEEEVFS